MDALDEVRRLGAKRLKLEAELAKVRAELADAIRVATAEGARQVDIVKATDYTREMVRQIQQRRAA